MELNPVKKMKVTTKTFMDISVKRKKREKLWDH